MSQLLTTNKTKDADECEISVYHELSCQSEELQDQEAQDVESMSCNTNIEISGSEE